MGPELLNHLKHYITVISAHFLSHIFIGINLGIQNSSFKTLYKNMKHEFSFLNNVFLLYIYQSGALTDIFPKVGEVEYVEGAEGFTWRNHMYNLRFFTSKFNKK